MTQTEFLEKLNTFNPTSKEDHRALALWAADCAEHVLVNFEEANAGDDRPKLAIQAGRDWVDGKIKMQDARKAAFASHSAARGAVTESAIAAARSAGHAAATAHVPTHSIYAITYAIASADEAGVKNEYEWQYRKLPKDILVKF